MPWLGCWTMRKLETVPLALKVDGTGGAGRPRARTFDRDDRRQFPCVCIRIDSIMTVVTGHLLSAPKVLWSAFERQVAVALRPGKHGAAVICSVTNLALRQVAVNQVVVICDPRLIRRMHSVRSAIDRARHRDVAGGAFGHLSDVPLEVQDCRLSLR